MTVQSPLPGPYRLTYADWLQFPDDGRLYEIIEGELFVSPPPNIAHQRISRDLGFRLMTYLEEGGRGEILDAPVGVRVTDESIVEPDLAVVLREHADRIGTQAIEGPPDLVVEVLSPGTAPRDLGAKRRVYEELGVVEYWIVDPETESVEVLRLEAGRYARHGLYRRADVLRSGLLEGLEIELGPIFERSRA